MDSYKYVITEVLLQRTKADSISSFLPSFLKRFPSWESIHATSLSKLEKTLSPIGLQKQRSKRLKRLAQEMVLLHGQIPQTREELEKLSLFGQYLCNAIELLLWNRRKPLLDVNMARVLERFFKKRKMADIRDDPFLQKTAYELANHHKTKEINWATLDFAAMVCKTKPKCFECPLSGCCNHYQKVYLRTKRGKHYLLSSIP